MIKYLFIVINSLSLFIFSLFSDDNTITVTSNIPSSITVGQEVVVDLKVNKADITAFATLQLELPESIVVKESENQGAAYSYENGIAKWVWATAPAENEIMVRVLFIASESAIGLQTISAKFSYVENNVKKVVEMQPVQVRVIPAPVTLGSVTPAVTSDPNMPILSTNSEPPGTINITRTITKVNDIEYLVSLKIKKGNTKGFTKYSDDIIDRVTAKAVKTDGSSFSMSTSDKKINFIWVNVPEKEELEISYTITGNFAGPVTLNGEYTYLEQNQSKKYKVTPETINAASEPVAVQKEEPKPEAPKQEAPKQETPIADPEISTAKTETKTEEKPAETLSTDVSKSQPDALTEKQEGKMNFSVQIGAFTNANTTAGVLKQKFNISETIKSDMQGGFSKFMVGSHSEYKEARSHSQVVKDVNGIRSAFVVAYNGSKRITVQEALMISNQKWFK